MSPAVPGTPAAPPAVPPRPAVPPGTVPPGAAVPPGTVVPPAPPPGGLVAPAPVANVGVPDEEIRIYGHNNLFYWWPVWAVGFLMALLTYLDGHVMAVVPKGTQVESGQVLPGESQPRDVLVAPPG